MNNNNDQSDKDRQSSPSPEPKTPAGAPFKGIEDLQERGREAANEKAQARTALEEKAAEPRPGERLSQMREALNKAIREKMTSREDPASDEQKPTVHDQQLRPPGTKPQPSLPGPGGSRSAGPQNARTQQRDDPAPSPQVPANREPTNAEKLYAKIEQSLKDRGQLPPARPDRAPDRDHER